MIHAFRGRSDFERLRRDGVRFRRSALWCTWCPDPTLNSTAVAFALSRALGSAVTRNRLRRRMRAILVGLDLPSGMMLIGANQHSIELTFDQLTSELRALTEAVKASSAVCSA